MPWSLADVAEQLCSIDPASDSVITCKYLPIFRDGKQPARAAIFDELFSCLYFFFAPRGNVVSGALKLR